MKRMKDGGGEKGIWFIQYIGQEETVFFRISKMALTRVLRLMLTYGIEFSGD